MKYTKIKISYPGHARQFYRTILVRGNPDLLKLATFYAFILNTEVYHCYYFETKDCEYVMAPFMEGYGVKTQKYLARYHLSDLPKKFTYTYDTGEDYEFNSTILGEVDYKSNRSFILLDAKGQGVWEDNHHSLYSLLEGKIDPNSSDEDDDYHLPWNFDNETYGDFFNPVDIEDENENILCMFSFILSHIKEEEKEYVKQTHISLDDLEPDQEFLNRIHYARKEMEYEQ